MSSRPVYNALASRPSRAVRDLIHAEGLMADLVRNYAWETTPLGPIDTWTQTQVDSTNLMLACRFPALVFLGPQLVVLYNDGYLEPMADKHPAALGTGAAQVWPEAWHVIGPQLAEVLPGGASTLQENLLIPVVRGGKFTDVWWTYSYSPLFEPDRRISGVFVVVHDVTSEVLSNRERERATERLHHILETCTDGVVLLDPEYRVTYANSEAHRLMAPARDILGKVNWEVFPAMVAADSPFLEPLKRALTEGLPSEFDAFYPEPYSRWLHHQVKPTEDGVIVFFRDITDQRRATETLIRTEKLAAVGRLAASIAHEINNPLEAVTNLIYLAQSSTTMDESQTYLRTAEQEIRRVSAIANQTLRFHKQASKPIPVSCDELFSSVLTIYQGRLANANVRVEKRKRCPRPVLCFDGEIRQILSNLVGNAIDAMPPPGGRLLLRSRTGCDWETRRAGMVITVADTGSGIPPETLRRIFDPFFTTKGFNGTGLGLWVSQEIAQRHEGFLRVRSRENQGTVFTLFLPFEAAVRC
jgi:signal transduction histidine kinase